MQPMTPPMALPGQAAPAATAADPFAAFKAQLDAMSPEDRAAFISRLVADYSGQNQQLQNKMALYQGMQQGAPQGYRTSGGFTSANPLQFIGNLAQNWVAMKGMKNTMGEQEGLAQQRAQHIRDILSSVYGVK